MLEIGTTSAGLIGAVAYGTGDFLGGRATLRLSTLSAVAIAQSVAALLMLQRFVGEIGLLSNSSLLSMSLIAGFAYALGLMALYHGFAHGRIGIVSPLCGLVSILIPLTGEILTGGETTEWQLIGVAICGLAVLLIAGSTRHGIFGVGCSLRWGLLSGLGYGTADLCLGLMPPEAATGSLLVTRTTAALIALSLVFVALMRPGRLRIETDRHRTSTVFSFVPHFPIDGRLLVGVLLAALAGLLDMLGHIGYVTSAVGGHMGVAAALVALFPAVSVVLAVLFINEKISVIQTVGFAFGILGINLVSD